MRFPSEKTVSEKRQVAHTETERNRDLEQINLNTAGLGLIKAYLEIFAF